MPPKRKAPLRQRKVSVVAPTIRPQRKKTGVAPPPVVASAAAEHAPVARKAASPKSTSSQPPAAHCSAVRDLLQCGVVSATDAAAPPQAGPLETILADAAAVVIACVLRRAQNRNPSATVSVDPRFCDSVTMVTGRHFLPTTVARLVAAFPAYFTVEWYPRRGVVCLLSIPDDPPTTVEEWARIGEAGGLDISAVVSAAPPRHASCGAAQKRLRPRDDPSVEGTGLAAIPTDLQGVLSSAKTAAVARAQAVREVVRDDARDTAQLRARERRLSTFDAMISAFRPARTQVGANSLCGCVRRFGGLPDTAAGAAEAESRVHALAVCPGSGLSHHPDVAEGPQALSGVFRLDRGRADRAVVARAD